MLIYEVAEELPEVGDQEGGADSGEDGEGSPERLEREALSGSETGIGAVMAVREAESEMEIAADEWEAGERGGDERGREEEDFAGLSGALKRFIAASIPCLAQHSTA